MPASNMYWHGRYCSRVCVCWHALWLQKACVVGVYKCIDMAVLFPLKLRRVCVCVYVCVCMKSSWLKGRGVPS